MPYVYWKNTSASHVTLDAVLFGRSTSSLVYITFSNDGPGPISRYQQPTGFLDAFTGNKISFLFFSAFLDVRQITVFLY